MQHLISVVINTYNRCTTLSNTLRALKQMNYIGFEVIVVNGPSTDDTAKLLSAYGDCIRILDCPDANLSKSRNVGLRGARGRYVCFLDDDAIPEPTWLERVAESFAPSEDIACVAGFLFDHTGVDYQTKYIVSDCFGDSSIYETFDEAQAAVSSSHGWRYFAPIGANSAFRRSALLEIGGFDEEYVYFLDETDVARRLHENGHKIVFAPRALVHHKYAPSHLRTEKRVPKSLIATVRSKIYFALRHGSKYKSESVCVDYCVDFVHAQLSAIREGMRYNVVDQIHGNRLLTEIEQGCQEGARDAFLYPRGRLLSSCEPQPVDGPLYLKTKDPTRTILRIVLLSQNYPPKNCGGIGVWFHTLATQIARLGHQVTVVTLSDNRSRVDFEDDVWVHRIAQPKHIFVTPGLPALPDAVQAYSGAVAQEITAIIDRRGVDIILTPLWDLEGIACLKRLGLPVVVALQSSYKLVLPTKKDWLNNSEYREKHVERIIAGEKWMLENADGIIAISMANAKDIEHGYEVRFSAATFSCIPIGITDMVIAPPAQEKLDKIKILFVGRFETRKGVDLLLMAIPDILKTYHQVEFILAGDHNITVDGSKTYLQIFLEEHPHLRHHASLSFPGIVDDSTLTRLYAECDIFVAPSRYESFGIIYVEAMRQGKPCIGVRVGGIPEVVSDGETGVLIPPDSAPALRTALLDLIGNPEKRLALGNAGRKRFEQVFSADAMSKSYESYLTNLVRIYRDEPERQKKLAVPAAFA